MKECVRAKLTGAEKKEGKTNAQKTERNECEYIHHQRLNSRSLFLLRCSQQKMGFSCSRVHLSAYVDTSCAMAYPG